MTGAERERLTDLEHELRGPVAALALLAERMRREPGARRHARAVEVQLARLRTALEDLQAERRGVSPVASAAPVELGALAEGAAAAVGADVRGDWEPQVVADRGRLAQALGNLLANAHEHGEGPIELRGRRVSGAVRVEVRNRPAEQPDHGDPDRGRGLRIAGAAVAAAGGRLELAEDEDRVVAVLELPVDDAA